MNTEVSTYEKQANDFLKKVKAKISVKFLKNGRHFEGDKEPRDIYEITLTNAKGEAFIFNFGQSINCSCPYKLKSYYIKDKLNFHKYTVSAEEYKKIMKTLAKKDKDQIIKNPDFKEPTAYDVLTSLQKYDVGSFEDFINEFGYNERTLDEYSKVQKIYQDVVNEYLNVKRLFSEEEIEQMQEIQ